MKQFLLVIFSLLLYSTTFSQLFISGRVTDPDKTPLSHVKINGTTMQENKHSDSVGNFSFYTNSNILIFSLAGYQSDTLQMAKLKNRKSTQIEIILHPQYAKLDNVIVVSHHLRNNILTNPIAISHVTSRTIDLTESTNLIDALVQNTPGLNAVQTGPNISKPFIRGLGYNRVLTLFDGVRQEGQQWGDEHGLEIDAYNTEGSDVIKGPASLLYGSDAEAGVISIRSVQPAKADGVVHGKFLSEYQTNNNLIGNGGSIYQRGEHWYWLASGSYRMAKNYRNSIDGRVYNTNFKEANAQFGIGHNTAHTQSHLNFTYYNNLQGIPDGSRDSLTRQFTKQIYENDVMDARPIVTSQELNSYQLSPLHQHIQHMRIYTDHVFHLQNSSMLSFSLAWQQNNRREYNHPEYPQQAGMYVRLNTVNYALKYSFAPMGKFDNQIGINGMYQKNKSLNATDFPIPDYHLFDFGAYAFSKFTSGKWTAAGGIRFDTRHTSGKDFYTQTNTTTGFSQHVTGADTVGAYLQFPALHLHFNGISASIGATYAASDHIHFKANIARGYRAPNINESAANGLDPGAHIVYIGDRTFKPEFSLQEDLGMEWNFPEISGGFSVFNNHISNYISLFQLTDAAGNAIQLIPGNWTYKYQQTSARLYGYEIYADYRPRYAKGWELHSMLSTVYGKNTNEEFKGKGIQGEYLSLIPPLKWVSSIEKEIVLSGAFSRIGLGANATVNGAQNQYFGLYNTETATPGYTLIGLTANTTIAYSKNGTIDINFFVSNLLDKAYQSNLSRLKYFEYYSASPNGHLGIYSMGRNYGIKAIVHF